jgi:MarR family transcriptional regulator, organic hydroperoxide resistance regulator
MDIAPHSDRSSLALRRFRIIFNAVKVHFQQMEKQAGIGGAQIWALSVIGQHPGIGVKALGAAMDIQQSTASNLVKALKHKDLLTIERAADDKRAVKLSLTETGRLVLQHAPSPWSGVLPDALAQLDEATLCRLIKDLDAVVARLGPYSDEKAKHVPLADL